jgi:hypothetical protein
VTRLAQGGWESDLTGGARVQIFPVEYARDKVTGAYHLLVGFPDPRSNFVERLDTSEPIHDRMPVILHPRDYELWLDPEVNDTELLKPLLRPYRSEEMMVQPVNPKVNKRVMTLLIVLRRFP